MSKEPCYQGSCLCGKIQFEVTQLQKHMAHCHCSMCRKFHGAAFATFGSVKSQNFRWIKGESLLKSFVAPNETTRKFCSDCGSSLIFESSDHDGQVVEFALAALDSSISEKPDAHIYVHHKANWCDINDELPVYQEGRR